MKKIKFSCSSCHANLRVPTHLAGVSAPCPKCGAIITAPEDFDEVFEEEPVSGSAAPVDGDAASKREGMPATAAATPSAPASRGAGEVSAEARPSPHPAAPGREAGGALPPTSPGTAAPGAAGTLSPAVEPQRESPAASSPGASRPRPSVVVEETILTREEATEGEGAAESLPEARSVAVPERPLQPVPLAPPTGAVPAETPRRAPAAEAPPERPVPVPSASSADEADSASAAGGATPEFSGSEITQPIRVQAHAHGALPPVPAAPSGSPYSGSDPSAAPPRTGSESTRLRLQLDRVGEGRAPSSPEDFIVPPQGASPQPSPTQAPPEENPVDLGQPIESLPVETQFEEPEEWEDSQSEAPPVGHRESGAEPAEPGDEAMFAREFGGSEPEFASDGYGPPESDPFADLESDPFAGLESETFASAEEPHATASAEFEPREEVVWDKGEAALPGSEGDLGTFFGEPPISVDPVSDLARDEPATRREEVPPPPPMAGSEEEILDDFIVSHPVGDFESSAEPEPSDASTAALGASVASAPAVGRGSDVDEMLGILGEESRSMATSTKVLLIAVMAASIIAVAAVVFVARGFGFFSGSEKPAGAPPVALVQEEQASGDRAGFPQELADPAEGVRDAPAQDRPAQERDQASQTDPGAMPPIIGDERRAVGAGDGQTAPSQQEGAGAITLDDRVQAIVGDPTLNPDARRSGSLIGSAALDPIVTEPTDFTGVSASSLAGAGGSGEPGASGGSGTSGGETTLDSADSPPSFAAAESGETATSFVGPSGEGASADAPQPRSTAGAPAIAAGRRDYNPPESFPAPGPGDGPLGKTHDLLDAFLRAPDLETRLRYSYGGESLRAAMEEYHKKWPYASADRFSKKLFQIDDNPDTGGPYWVYLISSSDAEEGFPVIIRVEDGLLKVDWEIYTEFQDRHFGQFLSSSVGSSGTFRLVLDRKSRYYGPDQDTFPDLDNYLVYQVNPPYGDVDEYSKYAFVQKGTDLANRLDEAVGLGEDPLAVILTLEVRTFPHGAKHFVISDYVTEGWFR